MASTIRIVLRPFHRFLGQAIHTAKVRQTRYQLPWERVRSLLTLRLTPVDTVLRVPRPRPGVVLAGWPAGKAPDLSQMGFVMNRSVPARFDSATQTQGGLRVHADVQLLPADRVYWCGVESKVQEEAAPPPPSRVTDRHGRALQLTGPPRADGDDPALMRHIVDWYRAHAYPTEKAAAQVVRALERGTPRLLITAEAFVVDLVKRLAPVWGNRLVCALILRVLRLTHMRAQRRALWEAPWPARWSEQDAATTPTPASERVAPEPAR
jgi:hypothetical protein